MPRYNTQLLVNATETARLSVVLQSCHYEETASCSIVGQDMPKTRALFCFPKISEVFVHVYEPRVGNSRTAVEASLSTQNTDILLI